MSEVNNVYLCSSVLGARLDPSLLPARKEPMAVDIIIASSVLGPTVS